MIILKWAIGVFLFLAIYGIFSPGYLVPGLIYGLIAVVLIYLKVNSKPGDFFNLKSEESRRRFHNDKFVSSVLTQLKAIDYKNDCIKIDVYKDCIITGKRIFKFSDYGYHSLSIEDCELLGIYLYVSLFNNTNYWVSSIKDGYARNSSYFLYETPEGNLMTGGGGDVVEHVVGYSVCVSNKK